MQSPINTLDVLICDEAHRIRSSSNSRFTRKDSRSERRQIEELLDACQVLVLFIDDYQIVRPNEIGSVQYVRDFVATRSDVDIHTYKLKVQFRCAGSESFINWVNNTLGIVDTTTTMLEPTSEFDFRICDTPEEMGSLIRDRAKEGSTARMMAGFCWPWSKPTPDGDLVEDVVIGGWKHPWNARPEAGRLKPGIPSASLWAHDQAGINQIGCIYSAQGFEFDYAGVIIGPDLTYDFDTESWKGHPSKSWDTALRSTKETYMEYAKNLYRVLLTRGMKGCYVYFVDKETERFVRSRIKH